MMSEEGLCSVVVPVYERPTELARALSSVLAQTCEDIDVVVVDDASPTPVVLPPAVAADRRVRLIRRELNGGVAAAQNTGLAEARGAHVGFLHSDDEWYPDRLRLQSALLADSPVAAVESGTLRATEQGEHVVGPRLEGATYDDVLCRSRRNLHISGFLFRTEALRAVGGFDEHLRAYEDFDLLIRLRARYDFLYSDDIVARLAQGVGGDRLADSPWMGRARGLLIDKYEHELISRYGAFPPVWRDWALREAMKLIELGRLPEARRRARRALGGGRRRRLTRWPLLAGTYLGRAPSAAIAAAYRRRLCPADGPTLG
jgi:glycosyltransferase involved in cell wall biosynthesis